MLRRQSSIFDLERVRESVLVRHLEFHSTLPSTNRTARDLLPALLQTAPALVLVDHQTAGIGRKGNAWWSSVGALTFSIVVDPTVLCIQPSRRPLMSIAAGLAIRDALSGMLPNRGVSIKWPNDVYIGNQKICGILSEQHVADNRQAVIIGIGVNVNNSLTAAPDDVRLRAVSMFDLQQQSFDMTAVLISILHQIHRRFNQIDTRLTGLLAEANRFHMLRDQSVSVQILNNVATGVCVGIDDDGCLVLQSESGIQRIASGVVLDWTQASARQA